MLLLATLHGFDGAIIILVVAGSLVVVVVVVNVVGTIME